MCTTVRNGDYQNKQIIAAGFGDPLSYRTFSGYSRHLFLAMREICKVVGYLSSQSLRISDICDGVVDFRPLRRLRKPTLSSKWLWSSKTVQKFSQRFQEKLSPFDEKIPILQVGTHVYPYNTNRKFYCITDMTVKQAAPHKGYLAGRLGPEDVLTAISVQRKLFDSYEKIFILCDWARKSVIDDFGCSPEKVITVGAGANMPPLEPAENKYSSHQILFVGYDWINKGGPLLLKAFRSIKRKFPDASLNIVGCRPKISEDGVRVFGRLSKNKISEMNELEKLYKTANCFCLMSEVDAFPNVLLEAQITQTPIVALDRGSRSEAVENGVTGILVKQSVAADVEAAFTKIFSDRATAQRMGQAGKQFVLERFTWPKVAEKILSHIFQPSRQ